MGTPDEQILTDWAMGHWVAAYGGLGLAFAVALIVPAFVAAGFGGYYGQTRPGFLVAAVVAGIAMVGTFLVLPGVMMRRIPESGWLALGCAGIALALVIFALWRNSPDEIPASKRTAWVAPAALALGTLGGFIVDGLSRVAAFLGVGLGAVALIALLGVVWVIAQSRR